jgi:tRNA 2-selenouridine synthase
VLSDAERITVGTLYKQASGFEAKKVGAAMVARNVAHHLETLFKDKPRQWKPLIYCWRGGSRSGAMTHILRQVGWDAVQLEGGYKQWRAQVVRDLSTLPQRFHFVAICGRTGSGKSRLIEALAQTGQQVLDLEALALHKGSVLGALPDAPQPSQKYFESQMWHALSTLDPARVVYVEAESKKIGMLRVPEALIARMWQGRCAELVTPKEERIALLCNEYAHFIAAPARLATQLECLRGLHSNERIDGWLALSAGAQWRALVEALLVHHYDPLYERSMFRNYLHAASAHRVNLARATPEGFLAAAQGLAAWGDTLCGATSRA